jgi:hypothetical protein
MLLGLLLFTTIILKYKMRKESISALITAGIYGLGMVVIYLLTPMDLNWHLMHSVNRTMFCVIGGIYVCCYYLLETIEKRGKITTNGYS